MNKWLGMIVLTGLVVLLASCGTPDTVVPSATPTATLTASDVQLITTGEAYELVNDGTAVLYDTRSVEEYLTLRVAGAVSFPEADVAARYDELPTDEPLIFY